MKLVVISPEHDRADEISVLSEMFAAGLERYHVRKPHGSAAELERWIKRLPEDWRRRLILHQYHGLVDTLGLGGRHWKDEGVRAVLNPTVQVPSADRTRCVKDNAPYLGSRSCHDLSTLRASLGYFDAVFFGPVFPSLSKPGYGPADSTMIEALATTLFARSSVERATSVFAIGGISLENLSGTAAFGVDGVAVLGAVWQSPNPIRAFLELADGCRSLDRSKVDPDVGLAHPNSSASPSQTGPLRASGSALTV